MKQSSIYNICKSFLKKYYQSSPKTIKKYVSPLVFFVKFRIISRIKNFNLEIYILEGKEKVNGNSLKVLLLGDKTSLMFIKNKLFKEETQINPIGKVKFFRINKTLDVFSKKVDAVFLKTDIFFSDYFEKKKFLITPAWVELKLDTSKDLKEVEKEFKKSAYEDTRLIKKMGYKYEITEKLDDFEYYFHKIRVPYLKERIGELTIPSTLEYEETKDIFYRSKFLIVKKNDEIVAGIFLLLHTNSAHACYMGIKEPSYYLPRGAGAALYYFSILWSKENNVKLLDFGNNRSFLNNGSLQYKRKWGSSISISKRFLETFAFKIYNFKSKAIIDFLVHNPLTFINGNKLKGMIFSDDLLSKKDMKLKYNTYYTEGLEKLYFVPIKNRLKETWDSLFEIKYIENKISRLNEDKTNVFLYLDKQLSSFNPASYNFDNDEKVDFNRINFLVREYDINYTQSKKIILEGYEQNFVILMEKFPFLKKEIVNTFIHTFESIKRQNLDVCDIDKKLLVDTFRLLSGKKINFESLPDIFITMLNKKEYNVDKIIEDMGVSIAKKEEIEHVVDKIIAENIKIINYRGESSLNILMGIIMKDLKYKADGKTVSKIIENKLKKILKK